VGPEWIVLSVLVLFLAGVGLWIYALVDAIRVPDDYSYRSGSKLVWVLVIVLAGFVGAIIYLLVGKPAEGTGAGTSRVLPPPPPPA
jgi:hypothetical protein